MLNKSSKKPIEFVINPEGAIQYKMNDDLTFFLIASSLKLEKSFYATEDERLISFLRILNNVNDFNFIVSTAKFLNSVMGVKLSPVIILTFLALKLRDTTDDTIKSSIKNACLNIFDRPDKIANACGLYQYLTNESFKKMPAFFKRGLKKALEKFNAYTLSKFRLERKQIKLKDLIKVFRPKPSNKELAKVYKDIIENKLKLKDDIKNILSDDKLNKEQKDDWINENVNSIPLNAFIRNLSNIPSTDENVKIFKDKVSKALEIKDNFPGIRILNPFDLIQAAINCNKPKFSQAISDALFIWFNGINLKLDDKKISILIDVSGSMRDTNIKTVASYLSILYPMIRNSNLKLFSFNTNVYDKTELTRQLNVANPLSIYHIILDQFKPDGGTSLADSMRNVYKHTEPDVLIVFSDEVSWADNNNSFVSTKDVPCNIIAINPAPISNFSAFHPSKPNLIRVAGLDAKIIYYISMLGNFNKFKEYIKTF